MKKVILFLFFLFLPVHIAVADTPLNIPREGWFSRFKQNLSETWHKGGYDLLIPVNTWHNRLTYDHDKIRDYNERPWGLGLSKSLEKAAWRHGLFFMIFKDSHDDIEPIAGYSLQKLWALDEAGCWRASLGLVLGITARSDYDYIPIAAPLPIFGMEYKRLSVESTYIPGGKNNGNILFTWLRWRF